MAEPAASQDLLVDEWKEARSSVGRFDEYLLNLRRYGFTLATILIGTDAYLSTSVDIPPWAKAGAAIVVMILIFALFLLDERVKLLQEAVLTRAVHLEKQLGTRLSRSRQKVAKNWHIKHTGVATYIFFLAAAGMVGAMSVLTTGLPESQSLALHRWLPTAIVSGWCVVVCVLTILFDKWAKEASKAKLSESIIGKGYHWSLERAKRLRSK